MAERIILDPSELATGRTQFDITPWIDPDGVDWGDAAIEAYRSQLTYGEGVVDYRLPNRQATAGLMLKSVGGTSFATVRSLIQAKAALYQREGGWVKRITASGGTVYADIQAAGLKLSGDWLQANRDADTEASIQLELSPDFYGNEVTLADHTETSATELVFTETNIAGDLPARVRVVVDEDDGDAQLGLIWSFRNRHYSNATTAATRFEAEALQPLDTAARAALTGASGGTVVTHGTLSSNWTPVLNLSLGGTAYMTHTGTNRLWVRYRTTSGTAVQLRAVWDVGDLVFPEENSPIRANAGTQFYIADLGELRLDPPSVGAHRWAGMLQGKGDVGGENLSIDRVWVVNADEGYGILRASPTAAVDGLSTFLARDEFNQSAGALTGKTLPVGGTWAGAGDADDFALNTTDHTARRTALSDSSPTDAGRFALAGSTNYVGVVVQCDIMSSENFGVACRGVFARYVDTSNWLMLLEQLAGDSRDIQLRCRIAGVTSFSRSLVIPQTAGQWWTFKLYVDARGNYSCWVWPRGGAQGDPIFTGWSSLLETAGTLDDGRVGFYDGYNAAELMDRDYDNFAVYPLTTDAVLHPSQSAQLATNGMLREDVGGTAYGPVSHVTNDLPRLPPTVEGGTTEVFLKASRGDFLTLPDTGIDDISARITYRPTWLFVPGS